MNHENCESRIRGKVEELVRTIRYDETNISGLTLHSGGIKTEERFVAFPLQDIEIRFLLGSYLFASNYRWEVIHKISDGDRFHFGKEIQIIKQTLKNPTIFR